MAATDVQGEFVRPLVKWYRSSGRQLPWRRTDNPYHIWISEIFLQQTQASRATEYFTRFVDRFPSVEALAGARWSQVYAVWRGAGYYQRARNVMKTAKIICKEFGGILPSDIDRLRSLPGIGDYTSAAICSFAFGRNVPAIDSNFNRVFQRYFGCPLSHVKPRAEEVFQRLRSLGPELNHAIMDLGATLCKSGTPNCTGCPLRKSCDFSVNERGGRTRQRGVGSERRRKTVIDVGVGCIHRKGRYLVGRRPGRKGGKWEFPGGKRDKGEDIRGCLKRELKEELGIEVSVRPPFLTTDRQEGDVMFRLHFCRCQIQRGQARAIEHEELAWLTPEEIDSIPFPNANAEAVTRLKTMKA